MEKALSTRVMSKLIVLFGLLVGALGCEGPARAGPLDNRVVNAGLDPKNPRILGLVTYFRKHGIQLVHDRGGWWRVAQPAHPNFDVIVSLRALPEGASVEQLQEALTRISLAYLFNAEGQVAMSYPGARGAGPGAMKDVRFILLKTELERLFRDYRPASAKPGAG
jgi:hypothetical protein